MTTTNPPAKTKRRFFVMTPQLVWALSRDPYDFMLWNVVKMVAWDKGECILGTRDLATLSMMSVGKVQDCRAYLLRMGLLEGELRRDPDYPQPVYHLRVPDLWQRNQQLIECELGHSLKKRVTFKSAQRQQSALPPAAPAPLLGGPDAAPADRGVPLAEQGLPPGEQGLLPGERGMPPGETNKITADTPERLEGQRGVGPPNPPEGGTVSLSPPIGGPGGPTTSPSNPPATPRRAQRGAHSEGGMLILSPPSGGSGGPPPDLQSCLLRLCRYEPEAVSSYRRKQMQEAVQRLGACRAQADDLAAFERWWYGHDWRGRRGEPPDPGAILDTWGRFKYQPQQQEAGYGRGYQFARPEEFGLA